MRNTTDEKLDKLAYKLYKKEHNKPQEIYAHIEFFIEHKNSFQKYYDKANKKLRLQKLKKLTTDEKL